VEAALSAAVRDGDLAPVKALLAALDDPYRDRGPDDPYRQPPAPDEQVLRTFCGT